jgi:hypothetical protein
VLPWRLAIALDSRDLLLRRRIPHAHVGGRPRSQARATRSRRSRRTAGCGPPGSDDRPREPRLPRATHPGVSPEDAVRRAITPGRTSALELSAEQRKAFADQEGLDALSILGHVLDARTRTGQRDEFPLTEGFVTRVARRLGLKMPPC